MKWIVLTALVISGLYIVMCCMLYALQDRLLYFPTPEGHPAGGTALVVRSGDVYDALQSRHGRIAVMGRNLGSGVATALAAARPVEKIIVITPYDSIARVAAHHYGWAPVRWLVKDPYDSERRMRDVHAPVLALIAGRDEVILRPRSDALVAAIAPTLRHFKVFPNATHNDINLQPERSEGNPAKRRRRDVGQPGYREVMREFLAAP